jgi:hypothetical protein
MAPSGTTGAAGMSGTGPDGSRGMGGMGATHTAGMAGAGATGAPGTGGAGATAAAGLGATAGNSSGCGGSVAGADRGPSDGGDCSVSLDPCGACEMNRCKIAQQFQSMSDPALYWAVYAAYVLCFSSVRYIGPTSYCGTSYDPQSTVATQGPATGTPKSVLCQGVLACLRSSPSMCLDIDCYCGSDPQNPCLMGIGTPNGDCKSVMEAAAETADPLTFGQVYANGCGALGAALDVQTYCDLPCCPVECGLSGVKPYDGEPRTSDWCVAPVSTGATAGASSSGSQ